MKLSKSSLVLTAAFTGLLGGTTARLGAAPASGSASGPQVTSQQGLSHPPGKFAGEKQDKEKHGCKGQNSCKGKGGCKSGDNGCKSKNSCKGKGGCATDGSKKPE